MRVDKRVSLFIAAAAAVALAGCSSSSSGGGSGGGGSSAPGPSALSSANGVTNITFWHAAGGAGGQELQSLVNQFNAAHQGKIKVNAVYQGTYPDLLAKYSAAVRSHTTPSMLMMYDVGTGYMDAAGQTVPAQQLAAENPGQLNPDDLQKPAREYYTVNGQLLSVPFNTSTPLLYVNTSLLAKAGLPANTPLNTVAEVGAAATKIKSATGVPGFTEPYDGWWVENLTSASGTTFCTPDNGRNGAPVTSVTLTGAKQDSALSVVAGLYRSGVALDTGTDGNEALTAFDSGKVAMMFNSSGAAAQVAKTAGFSWRALPYPHSTTASAAGPIIGGASLWVSRNGHSTAEQEASWQLISFLDSPASQAAFSQATGYVPVNTATPNLPSYQATLAKQPALKIALDQLEGTGASVETAGCLSGALPTVRTDVISALQSAFSGAMPLKAALSSGQSKADKDIQSYLQLAGQ